MALPMALVPAAARWRHRPPALSQVPATAWVARPADRPAALRSAVAVALLWLALLLGPVPWIAGVLWAAMESHEVIAVALLPFALVSVVLHGIFVYLAIAPQPREQLPSGAPDTSGVPVRFLRQLEGKRDRGNWAGGDDSMWLG